MLFLKPPRSLPNAALPCEEAPSHARDSILLLAKAQIKNAHTPDLFAVPVQIPAYVRDGHIVAPHVAIRHKAPAEVSHARALIVPAHKPQTVEDKPSPGITHFYVSAVDGGKKHLVAGPYATLEEAKSMVEGVRRHADSDPRAHFMAWGTAGSDREHKTPLGKWAPPADKSEAPRAQSLTGHSGRTRAERMEDRQDRLDARSDKLRRESSAAYERSHQISERFAMGQPIILNHHSTRGAMADRDRMNAAMRRSVAAADKAEAVESVKPSSAIMTVDADAPELLQMRIDKLERDHAKMKQTNFLARKGDIEGLRAMGYSDKSIEGIMKPDWGKPGVPDYMLTNNSANIRRLKERLPQVVAAQSAESTSRMVGEVKVEEDVEAQRIRLHFPGKPAADMIAKLKSHGFRWAPSERAWQRQLTGNGRYAADQVLA